jgi:hypothetical protein
VYGDWTLTIRFGSPDSMQTGRGYCIFIYFIVHVDFGINDKCSRTRTKIRPIGLSESGQLFLKTNQVHPPLLIKKLTTESKTIYLNRENVHECYERPK